jgi:hypothetical protein
MVTRRPAKVLAATPPPASWVAGWAAREQRRMRLPAGPAAMLRHVAGLANGSGVAFVHQGRAATRLGVTVRTVERRMVDLVAAGVVVQVVAANKHQAAGWQLVGWPESWRRAAERETAAKLDLDPTPSLALGPTALSGQAPACEPETVCDVVSRDVFTLQVEDVVAGVCIKPPAWARRRAQLGRKLAETWTSTNGGAYFARFKV